MTAPSSGHSPLRKLLLVLAVAALLGGGAVTVWYLARDARPVRTELQLLQAAYGSPPGFTVIFARDGATGNSRVVRREVWVYPAKAASFIFVDGRFAFSADLPGAPAPAGRAGPALRPADIQPGRSLAYLSRKLGGKPVRSQPLPADLLADAVRHDFPGGATAVFQHDRLMFVQVPAL